MHFPWSHKIYDGIAAGFGAGLLATLNMANIQAGLQIVFLLLSIVFVLLGVVMRSERFVRRVARVMRGEPMVLPAEAKEEREEQDEEG